MRWTDDRIFIFGYTLPLSLKNWCLCYNRKTDKYFSAALHVFTDVSLIPLNQPNLSTGQGVFFNSQQT